MTLTDGRGRAAGAGTGLLPGILPRSRMGWSPAADRHAMMKLPPCTHRFFWDVDPSQLDVDAYPHYVVERLLEVGDVPAVRWMLAAFAPEEIIQVLTTSRRLTPLSATFWALYFGVDKEAVPCLSTPSRPEPEPVWLG
jgi:hypothetical protein